MILTSPAARGLFRAIVEDPADDVPRLLLADVLEDSGEVERAEFIRVQCELERLPPTGGDKPLRAYAYGKAATLRRRERELLLANRSRWQVGLPRLPFVPEQPGEEPPDQLSAYTFRRGFVTCVTLTLADWHVAPCRSCAGSGEDQRESTSGDCPHCHGTGKTGGYGPALVLAAPIEEVIISEPKPRQWLRNLWWYDHLPEVLAPYLDRQTGPHNATEEAARAALNRAALTQARQEAGLPALA
jgi:uncharacterized protein (TIGR02996 family)